MHDAHDATSAERAHDARPRRDARRERVGHGVRERPRERDGQRDVRERASLSVARTPARRRRRWQRRPRRVRGRASGSWARCPRMPVASPTRERRPRSTPEATAGPDRASRDLERRSSRTIFGMPRVSMTGSAGAGGAALVLPLAAGAAAPDGTDGVACLSLGGALSAGSAILSRARRCATSSAPKCSTSQSPSLSGLATSLRLAHVRARGRAASRWRVG